MTKLVCISDTHSYHNKLDLPEGDVLVHAGDITWKGELSIFEDFANWLSKLQFREKVIIFGNHETGCNRTDKGRQAQEMIRQAGAIYLEDSGTTIDGMLFWGSPYQPEFGGWEYNLPRGQALANKWLEIPLETTVLITHGPVHMVLDQAPRGIGQFDNVGCEELAKRIKQLPNLKAHIAGHIHRDKNQPPEIHDGVIYVNASICDNKYQTTNKPVVIEIGE